MAASISGSRTCYPSVATGGRSSRRGHGGVARSSFAPCAPASKKPSTLRTIGRKWPELQGARDWDGLLSPLDVALRGELVRYGEFVRAAYASFDCDDGRAPSYGSCRFPSTSLLRRAGLPATGYRVTRLLHAASAPVPGWLTQCSSSYIGYVSVCDDEAEIARLGRRDVVVAYRGTATCGEWVDNLQSALTRLPTTTASSPATSNGEEEAMVESGFWRLFTAPGEAHGSLQQQVRDEARRIVREYGGEGTPPLSITVTGHSLGAALAVLTAHEITTTVVTPRGQQCRRHDDDDEVPIMVTAVSFGGPRVGNAAFRRRLEESGGKVLRVVNSNDVVTKVPGFAPADDGDSRRRPRVPRWLVSMMGWAYSDVGRELRLSSSSRQPAANVVASHGLDLRRSRRQRGALGDFVNLKICRSSLSKVFIGVGVAVKVNSEIGCYFQTKKGLRQGDPLSPILFNLVVDMLAIFIARAKEDGQLQGLISDLINDGLSILHLAMYMMSFFKVPKGILKKLDFYTSSFFWQGGNHRKKYRLTKWDHLCLPKDQGGLGILNLEAQNACLLSKWLYKLINEDGLWQQLLRKKYLKNKTIGEVFWKPGDSHFWSGLMKVKDQFMDLSAFQLHNSLQTKFWEDKWLGNYTLKKQYLSLFTIVRKKQSSVAHVLSTNPLNISFRRVLVGDKLIKWNELVARIAHVQLVGHHDKAVWSITEHGQFTVKSLYNFSVNQIALPMNNKKLWKLKLALKIKIFIWFLMKCVILTKDNLKKRNWNGDNGCCFCNKETIQHLFFDCHVAIFVWRIVQGYILDKVLEFTSNGGWQKLFEVGMPYVKRRWLSSVATGGRSSSGHGGVARSSFAPCAPASKKPSTLRTIGRKWPELQGARDWDGLLSPLDGALRGELVRYGEFVRAAYASFDCDDGRAPSYGSCRFPSGSLLCRAGLPATGYRVTRLLHAASASVPGWLSQCSSSYIGYVAVCDDEAEIARLGRRDVVVAYRGTATCGEWVDNLQSALTRLPTTTTSSPATSNGEEEEEEAMVESGFWRLFTAPGEAHGSLQQQVRDEARRIVREYGGDGTPPLSITVTGHSLGAALAVLTAHEITTTVVTPRGQQCRRHDDDDDEVPIMVTAVSFGGPRVGNAAFRRRLEESGGKVLRVVNSNDVVTKVPGFAPADDDDDGDSRRRPRVPRWLVSMMGWAYSDVGRELRLSSRRPAANVVASHGLDLYLELKQGDVSVDSEIALGDFVNLKICRHSLSEKKQPKPTQTFPDDPSRRYVIILAILSSTEPSTLTVTISCRSNKGGANHAQEM
ncbi:hypothetical protein U9M48_005255, partial [Paspalum notatum var. saurae]